MNRAFILCIFLINFTLVFSNSDTIIEPANEISIHLKKLEISDSILNSKFDSVITKNKLAIIDYEEKLKNSERIIENQDSLIKGFGTVYTVLTILIALISVLLPVLFYFFGIRPSRQALKEVNERLDDKFNLFVDNNFKKQMDEALENLSKDDVNVKGYGLRFLQFNQHVQLSETHIAKLYGIAKSESDNTIRYQLIHLLSNQLSIIPEDYFIDSVKQDKEVNELFYSLRYFANIGIDKYLPYIKENILNDKKPEEKFFAFSGWMINISTGLLKSYFNYKPLIDSFEKKSLAELCEKILKNYGKTYNLEDIINKSYLYEKSQV